MVETISYNKVTRVIKRNALGKIELAVTFSKAADAAQMQPVPVPQHLDAMIVGVTHSKVALIIKCNTLRTIKLLTATAAFPDDAPSSTCSCSPPPPLHPLHL